MSGFTLKLIAIICMTIDHLYKLAPEFIGTMPYITVTTPWFSITLTAAISLLGRIAFPLFAFGVSEGCTHTKDFGKYLRRLFLFAVISEIPFDYMFFGSIYLGHQNVMWTFFFGVLAVYLYNSLKGNSFLALFSVFATAVVCYVFKTDYCSIGVLLIFVLYIAKSKPLKLLGAILVISLYYLHFKGIYAAFNAGIPIPTVIMLQFAATLSSVIIMAFYNGKQGPKMKWFFYLYYPLHLLVLGSIDKLWTF